MHRIRVFLLSLAAILSGCAAVLPVAELRTGITLEDAKKKIAAIPTREGKIPPPPGENGTLYAVEYNIAEQQNYAPSPHWLLFYENQLATYGRGDIRVAEVTAYYLYYSSLARRKVITWEHVETAQWNKVVELYGYTVPNDYRAYAAYRIELAIKLDRGELDEATVSRLYAEREAEMSARADAAQRDYAAQQQVRTNQSLMLMGLGAQMMQSARPAYNPTINCTSIQQGAFTNTNCR